MAEYLGQEFKGTTEEIDGNVYEQCRFTDCTLVYRGGAIPQLRGCNIERCVWLWSDAALRTIGFLRGIYSAMGPGGRKIVDEVVAEIHKPFRDGKSV